MTKEKLEKELKSLSDKAEEDADNALQSKEPMIL